MKTIYILCEGATEESFVNTILYDYFSTMNIYVYPTNLCGISNYEKFKKELSVLCRNRKNDIITTMIDYYGLRNDFPEINNSEQDIYKKIEIIEKAIKSDIDADNLTVYISLHEFETLLYSEPQAFSSLRKDISKDIEDVVNKKEFHGNIELINNLPNTAPSKRIKSFYEGYVKLTDGTKLAQEIGIQKMLLKCKHFSEWINKLKSF